MEDNDDIDHLNLALSAFHEAGHALVAAKLRQRIKQVTIEKGGLTITLIHNPPTRSELVKEITISVAGNIAEQKFLSRYGHEIELSHPDVDFPDTSAACQEDKANTSRRLREVCSPEEEESFLTGQFNKAEDIVFSNMESIETLALELYRRKTFMGRKILQIVNSDAWAKACTEWLLIVKGQKTGGAKIDEHG